jgi:hypothetical protein
MKIISKRPASRTHNAKLVYAEGYVLQIGEDGQITIYPCDQRGYPNTHGDDDIVRWRPGDGGWRVSEGKERYPTRRVALAVMRLTQE